MNNTNDVMTKIEMMKLLLLLFHHILYNVSIYERYNNIYIYMYILQLNMFFSNYYTKPRKF